MPPRLAVLMTVYNGAAYLRTAVESILNQTFRDLVLVVVDDGSTDDGPKILAELARIDSRVDVVSAGRLGRTGALNLGLDQILAMPTVPEYLAYIDADDRALPHRLEVQVRWLDQRPDAFAVGGQVRLIDNAGNRLNRRMAFPVGDDAIRACMKDWHGSPIANPSALLRTRFLPIVGRYREGFAPSEDLDFWLRASEHFALGNLDDVVLEYRLHGANASIANNRLQRTNAYKAWACAAMRAHGFDDSSLAGSELTVQRLLTLPLPADEPARLASHFANTMISMDDESHLESARADLELLEIALGSAARRQSIPLSRLRAKLAIGFARHGRRTVALRYALSALVTHPGVTGWLIARLVRGPHTT